MPQATEVRDPQLPENSCILVPEVLRFEAIEESVTVALVLGAVYLYQTSSSGVPVAHPTGILALAEAFHTVPAVFATPLVSEIAPLQSSFAGGGV